MLTNLLNALSPDEEDKIFTGVLEKRSRTGHGNRRRSTSTGRSCATTWRADGVEEHSCEFIERAQTKTQTADTATSGTQSRADQGRHAASPRIC